MTIRQTLTDLIYLIRHPEIAHKKLEGYSALKSDNQYLKNQLSLDKDLIINTLKVVEEIRMPVESIAARVEANKGATSALIEWENTIERKLEARVDAAEEGLRIISGAAFSIAMDTISRLDDRAQKVPYMFYDTINNTFTYTPATIRFLGLNKKEIESLSLSKLLRRVKREYLEGPSSKDSSERSGILPAIRAGVPLNEFEAETTDPIPIQLKLTTYPVMFNNQPVGIGILLYDDRLHQQHAESISQIDNLFRKATKYMNKQFNKLIPKPKKKLASNI